MKHREPFASQTSEADDLIGSHGDDQKVVYKIEDIIHRSEQQHVMHLQHYHLF